MRLLWDKGKKGNEAKRTMTGEPRDEIGFGPSVQCRKLGHFYDFVWTYKENGILDRPRCTGCGKLFDYEGDKDHVVFSIK